MAIDGPVNPWSDQMPAQDYIRCDSCGHGIGRTQAFTQIYNLRYHANQYFHADHLGCSAATQLKNSRPRIVLNRYRKGIISELMYGGDGGEGDSYADKVDDLID